MSPTIVFAGDSITDAGHRETERSPLGSGYVALLAPELVARGWNVVNAGIAGDRVRDVSSRWHTEVEEASPDVVSLLVGINDVWRRFSDDDPTSAMDFESGYRSILDRQASSHVRWVLCEPFLMPLGDGQETWADDLDGKRAVVRTLAREYGATLVPLHELFTSDVAEFGVARLTTDGVHLTALGYERLATHWRALATDALS